MKKMNRAAIIGAAGLAGMLFTACGVYGPAIDPEETKMYETSVETDEYTDILEEESASTEEVNNEADKEDEAETESLQSSEAEAEYEKKYLSKVDVGDKNYSFFYLNDDDVPEMAVYGDGMIHNSLVDVYTIEDDEVINLGSYGGYDHIGYKEKEGVLVEEYDGNGGRLYTNIYKMGYKKCECIASFIAAAEEDGPKYYVNDKETDGETYKSRLDEYEKHVKTVGAVSSAYKLPDWKHYEDQMSEEDKKDFDEYLAVLNGDEKFICFDWGGDKERSFSDYLSSIESKSEPDIEGVTLVDLDDQNGKELILEIYEGGGNYLILTRDDEKFYGTSMGARCFEELQKDGKYLGAGGAGDAYYYKMKIDSNGVKEIPIGELHGEEKPDGSYGDRLEVNGEVIEDAKKWIEENYSDPVDWIQ